MKKGSTVGTRAAAPTVKNSPANPDAPYVVQMKPRGKLFVVLLVVFGLWFALLAWMYLTTVKPARPAEPVTGVAMRGPWADHSPRSM